MNNMSLFSTIFINFPEELFIVITTLVVVGYRDALNFKDEGSLLKLLFSSCLMVINSVICNIIFPSPIISFFIQLFIFYIIIFLIYRCGILACVVGILVSAAVIVFSRAVLVSLVVMAFKLPIEQINSDDILKLLIYLPVRIAQLVAFIVVCKVRNIRINTHETSSRFWILIMLFCVIMVGSMVALETALKSIHNSFFTILSLMINICIDAIFSAWLLFNIFKLKKANDKMRNFELNQIKNLLLEGKVDYAIQLIDTKLEEQLIKDLKKMGFVANKKPELCVINRPPESVPENKL